MMAVEIVAVDFSETASPSINSASMYAVNKKKGKHLYMQMGFLCNQRINNLRV